MKKCISCGKEIEDNATICPYCEAKLENVAEDKLDKNSPKIMNSEEETAKIQEKPQVTPMEKNDQKPQVQQQTIQPQNPLQQQTSPQQHPPQQRPMQQAQPPVSKPVSTAGFFLMMLLFAIPVIGWILCIVMGFTAKNSNRRSFARACLIWLAILLFLSVAAFAWYSIWGKDSIGMIFSFENRTFSL